MYKVNIAEILLEVGKRQEIIKQVPIQDEDDFYKIDCLAEVELTAENVGQSVLVSGKLKADATMNCVRCNEPVRQTIELDNLEQEYNYEDKILHFNEEDKEVGLEELQFIIDEKGNIDLEDFLKQEIILALPLKPICNNCHNEVSYSTGKN